MTWVSATGRSALDEAAPRPAALPRAGWLRAARVRDWAHFLLLPLAGYEHGAGLATNAASLSRGVVIAFCVLAFGYLLNGVADRHMDASDRKNPLVGRAGTSQRVPLFALAALALAASLLGPWIGTAATAVGLASGVVYSVGPRIKRFPVLGTLANATNFAPLLWVGLPSHGGAQGMAALTGCFVLLLLQNQLLHEAADRDEDAEGGVLTTVRLLGPRASAVPVALLGVGLTLLAVAVPGLGPLAVPLALLFALGTAAASALKGADVKAMARARIAHRVVSLLAGAAIFWLLRLGA